MALYILEITEPIEDTDSFSESKTHFKGRECQLATSSETTWPDTTYNKNNSLNYMVKYKKELVTVGNNKCSEKGVFRTNKIINKK